MTIRQFFTSLLVLLTASIAAQDSSTYNQVYTVFQGSCAFSGCHNSSDAAGTLDLEGAGSTLAAKKADVYNNLYNQVPDNNKAADKNNKLIYPGHPYKSFIFRKVQHNTGLAANSNLENGEGKAMPENGPSLSNKKLELIRQWILYGAPDTGKVIDTSLINEYVKNGYNSMQKTPAPPAEGEGFQIHLGPFLVEPGGEKEYFLKYRTDLEETKDVNRIDTYMGDDSHHFILFKYREGEESKKDEGLRFDNAHTESLIVTANQYPDSMILPDNTAFIWEENTVLDLNSHYINYPPPKPLGAEVYLNVYTDDSGTAAQEMNTIISPNYDIVIPNDGNEHTFRDPVSIPANDTFHVWATASHTHQWGTDFDLYNRKLDGTKGEHVYDASCPNGIPGCSNPNYDYQHPPIREWDYPFYPLHLQSGAIQEATWVNNGPDTVRWGPTSEDEMMVAAIWYVNDLEGIDTTATQIAKEPKTDVTKGFSVYPNPSSGRFNITYRLKEEANVRIQLYDMFGKKVREIVQNQPRSKGTHNLEFTDRRLSSGVYYLNLNVNEQKMVRKIVKL